MNAHPRGRTAVVAACLASLPFVVLAQEPPSESPTPDQPTTQPVDADTDEPVEDEAEADADAPDAQPTPDAEPATEATAPMMDEEGDLSADELQALESALAADAEESSESVESTPVGPVPTAVQTTATGSATTVNYDLAFILDVAGAWFSADEPLQSGAHDPSQTGFNFQQLEMSVGASVDPYFRFDANLVFSPFGVEVEEAYGTTLALPASLQVRAGQFLTPFGRLNPTHPHAWTFLDQPIANGKFFGGEGSRGLGVELSWLSPLPWYVELTGAASQADGECCARSFYGGDNPGVRGPQDLLYTTRIEQFFPFSDTWSLLWGVSAQLGPNSSGLGNRTEIYGTDFYLRYKPVDATNRSALGLQIEGMFRTRQVPGDVAQDFGGYATLDYQISQRWQTALRHEYVSGVEDDPLDPDWTGDRHRTSVQTTFFPSHFSRLRLQLAYDAPSWLEEPGYAAMLGLELLVGAHGSHEY